MNNHDAGIVLDQVQLQEDIVLSTQADDSHEIDEQGQFSLTSVCHHYSYIQEVPWDLQK